MSVRGKRLWPCFILLGLLLTACSQSTPPAKRIAYPTASAPSENIPRDLWTFPQSATRYIAPQTTVLSSSRQAALARRYLECFFSPWTSEFRAPSRSDLQTRYSNLTRSRGLGENLRPLGSSFLVKVADNAALETFPSRSTCALPIYGRRCSIFLATFFRSQLNRFCVPYTIPLSVTICDCV